MEVTTAKAKYPQYPAYKDSGIEWLGEIPEGWEIERLGTLLSPKSIKGQPNLPLLSITRELGVIERDLEDEDSNHNYIPDDLSGYKVIQKGQFGMNKMKAWQGSYGVSPKTGIISPAYYVFDFTSEIDPNFFHIAIRSKSYVAFFGQASDGVRIGQWDLSKSRMKAIPFILPPLPEQTAIAYFLDDKCAKIDRAIAQKEKLIALLKERKQIVIQNAVTGKTVWSEEAQAFVPVAESGVEVRDSGVEWIGEIPAHWEVVRSKFLFVQRKEKAKKNDIQLSATQAYGVIPQDEYEQRVGRRVVKIQFHLDKRKHVKTDDFVISMRSFQGGLERAWSSGCIRSSYVVLKAAKKLDAEYYSYLFKTTKYITALQSTANFIRDGQDLNFDNFSKVDLFTLPIQEQRQIGQFLQIQTTKINQAITLQQTQIDKLKEYKATLIDSAVRGKIKVVE